MARRAAGHCIFCGTREVTKAHVFAKSWTGLFDEPNDIREHEVVHRYTHPETGEQHEMKRAKTFALMSRNVCGTCNSGWLSELEERVKPVMADFAANRPVVLDAAEQTDLALWASVTILIAMSMDPDAADFADPVLAPSLRSMRTPTPGMDIWLGANSHGEMGWVGSHSLNISPAPEHKGAWGATITFGYAVIHIICHDVPEQRIRLKRDARRSLRRIWGAQERVTWPPQLRLQLRDLSPLAIIISEQSSFERAAPRRAA